MREMHVMVADVLSAELDALQRRHGPWRLTWALVAILLRRSWSKNRVADLDAHMRRDIGLTDFQDLEEERLRRQLEWKRYL
jgi:hypothetical protein